MYNDLIEKLKNIYPLQVNNYNNYMLSSSINYVPPYKPRSIINPYNLSDIPNWYPDLLKKYLSEVSSEMLFYTHPCKINLFDISRVKYS